MAARPDEPSAVSSGAPAAPLPRLTVTLRPQPGVRGEGESGGAEGHIDVELVIETPDLPAGAPLLAMPTVIVSIPTARYDGDAVRAEDGVGPLPLVIQDEDPTPSWTMRRWILQRATRGDVRVRFCAHPRRVSRQTVPGPYFDLRAEAGGFLGAGVTFLALPDTGLTYRIRLRWDLGAMPASVRAVSSYGEGDLEFEGKVDRLAYAFYAVGPLRRHPDEEGSAFHLYWLSEPPFDIEAVADYVGRLYDYMADFFRDQEKGYRVIARRNPYPGIGGTALPRSFMFGYDAERPPAAHDLQTLLAHEMVHNWPSLENGIGALAWYNEGTAEFYSLVLPFRAGLLGPEKFLDEINRRAAAYYTNPLRGWSLQEAARIYWVTPLAQRLPYQRGFMYLTAVDAAVRAATGGERGLDDLVLALLERQRRGRPHGVEQWLELVTAELGPEARDAYEAMMAGKRIAAPAGSPAPGLKPEPIELPEFRLGFDLASLRGEPAVVRGLEPGSNAARAGLREGDEVVDQLPNLGDLLGSPGTPITFTVRRGGKLLEITYQPWGDSVPAYRWVWASPPA